MSATVTLNRADAEALVTRALTASGTSTANARSTAVALVAAEIDGQTAHGLSRVPSYAAQVKVRKVAGQARPLLTQTRRASVQIDACGGFAYPALDLAIDTLPVLVPETGVAAASIYRSHHIGQAGRTVERLADRGLLALAVSNTPRAMAFPGGVRPMLGTNPLAFAAPVDGRAPLVVDLALSVAARGKIVAAERAGQKIPPEWATDANGQPTSDPTAALAGALTAAGGAKGAALALMIEVLCAALAGGNYGWEASSFLDDRGPSPGVGQMLIAFDPAAFNGSGFSRRMRDLVDVVTQEPGVRLPGERRLANRERASIQGFTIASDLHAQISRLASMSGASN